MSDTRAALVLSGGGAFGAYEIGVIKALTNGDSPATGHTPLDPQIFTGTSVGSFNAAMLAMNKGGMQDSIGNLEAVWRDQVADKDDGRGNGVYRIRGNPSGYLDLRTPGSPAELLQRFLGDTAAMSKDVAPRMLHLFANDASVVERVESLVHLSAFIDIEPFCHLVQRNLDPEALRRSRKILRVLATNWKKGIAHEFRFREMTDEHTWDAIRASAAIPGLFPSVEIGHEKYIDGGVVQNTPIKPAIEEGASEIHVVSLNAKLSQFPNAQLENTITTFSRVYTAMLSGNLEEDIESARWVNEGVEVLEKCEAGGDPSSDEMRRFARVAGVISKRLRHEGKMPRSLTIHRYFPDKCLGDLLGMLNFHASAIDALIADGYADALAHDCRANGCVLGAGHARAAVA